LKEIWDVGEVPGALEDTTGLKNLSLKVGSAAVSIPGCQASAVREGRNGRQSSAHNNRGIGEEGIGRGLFTELILLKL